LKIIGPDDSSSGKVFPLSPFSSLSYNKSTFQESSNSKEKSWQKKRKKLPRKKQRKQLKNHAAVAAADNPPSN